MAAEHKLTYDEIRERQAIPYEIKLRMSLNRVRDFINYYGESGVAICFSGGVDSTMAVHFIRNYCGYDKVKAISVIGIENKYNIDLIKKTENVDIVKVRYSQKEILERFGVPIISKRVSKSLKALQNPTEKNANIRNLALTGITSEGRKAPTYKLAKKWYFLIDAPFKISNQCCYYMKETPLEKYAKEKGYGTISAITAEESKSRMDGYAKQGSCNVFKGNGYSTPFAFWTHQDILRYLYENQVEISEAYGEIVEENGVYRTTKAQRTGCPVCLFGMQFDEYPNRFQRMYYEDHRQWKNALVGMGLKDVLDFMVKNGHPEYKYYPAEIEEKIKAGELTPEI